MNLIGLLLLVTSCSIGGSSQNQRNGSPIASDPSGGDDLLGLLGSLLNSDAEGDPLGQIVEKLGSVFNQQNTIDDDEGTDGTSQLLSTLGSLLGSSNDVLPMLLQTWNSFYGEAAQQRKRSHKEHANLVPPSLEKFHIFFDNLMHSNMVQAAIKSLGAENFVKIFRDGSGRFSYDLFMEKLENQSFRRYWIEMVANKLTGILSHISDPASQKMYVGAIQQMINGYLSSEKYPKSALLDIGHPAISITNMINEFTKRNFNTKVESKEYVVPVVQYVQDILRLAQVKVNVANNKPLLDTLTDTINLDIIEPILRGNRAYRFAKNQQECDRYVMCLVNQDQVNDGSSLSAVKPLLSKGTTLILSWFLSSHTKTPFLTYYDYIINEHSCSDLYKDSCHSFHLEEIKVTTEYVHNEL